MSLHVDVTGSGPDIVLLHGWAMHGGVFTPLVERLQDRFRLHVVDLPGHGGSRACDIPLTLPDSATAIARVVPEDALWCGWSLGGLVALYAASHGTSMRSLAMLCASPCFVRKEDWRWGMSPEIFRDFATGLRDDWRGTLDRFLALEAFGSEHAKEELRHLRNAVLARGEPAARVLADGLQLLETSDLRGDLPSLTIPSAWIAGRRDRLVDPRGMEEAASLAPNTRFSTIDHAGHAPFLTHVDAVIGALQPLLHPSE